MDISTTVCPNLSNIEAKAIMEKLTDALGDERRAYNMWHLGNGQFGLSESGDVFMTDDEGNTVSQQKGESQNEFINRRYEELILLDNRNREAMYYHLKHPESATEYDKLTDEEKLAVDNDMKAANRNIQYGRILMSAIDTVGHYSQTIKSKDGKETVIAANIRHRSSDQIREIIDIAIRSKKKIRVLSHEGTVLGAIVDNSFYINTGAVNPYVQMYEYTQLMAWRMYNSKDNADSETWKEICDFLTTQQPLTDAEEKLLADAKKTAMNNLGITKEPNRKKDKDTFNLYIAEILSVLSARESGKVKKSVMDTAERLAEKDKSKSIDLTSYNRYPSFYKRVIKSLSDMLNRFWEKVISFFTGGGPAFATLTEVSRLSFNDLIQNAVIRNKHTGRHREEMEKSVSTEELARINDDVRDIKEENIRSFTFEPSVKMTDAQIRFMKKNNQRQWRENLKSKMLADERLTLSEKQEIPRLVRETFADIMTSLRDQDNEYDEFFTQDELETISTLVKWNNYDPFFKILQNIGIGRFTDIVMNAVIRDTNGMNDTAEQEEVYRSFLNDYKNILMVMNYDFFRATIGVKLKLKQQKTNESETSENKNDNIDIVIKNESDENDVEEEEDDYADENNTEDDDNNESSGNDTPDTDENSGDTVNDFLQTSQMHRAFYKNIDGAVKLYLSTIPNNDASNEVFNRPNFSPNEYLNILVSNFNWCKNVSELKTAIERDDMPGYKYLIPMLENNPVFADKLLSTIRMAFNQITKYYEKSSEGGLVMGERTELVYEGMSEKEAASLVGTYSERKNKLFVKIKNSDEYVLNRTRLNEARKELHRIRDEWWNRIKPFLDDPNADFNAWRKKSEYLRGYSDERYNRFYTCHNIEQFKLKSGFYGFVLSKYLKKYLGINISAYTITRLVNAQPWTKGLSDKIERMAQDNPAPHNTYNMLHFIHYIDDMLSRKLTKELRINYEYDESWKMKPFGKHSKKYSSEEEFVQDIHKKLIFCDMASMIDSFELKKYPSQVWVGGKKTISVFSPMNYFKSVSDEFSSTGSANFSETNIKTRMRKSAFHKNAAKNPTTNDLGLALTKNNLAKMDTTAIINDKSYSDIGRLEYLAYAISSYNRGYMILPVLADKSTHYSVAITRYHDIVKDEKGFYSPTAMLNFNTVFMQEIDRMRLLYATRNSGSPKINKFHTDITENHISNTGGFRFAFFPMFNPMLQYMSGAIKAEDLSDIRMADTADMINDYILGKTDKLHASVTNWFNDAYRQYMENMVSGFENRLRDMIGVVKCNKSMDTATLLTLTNLLDKNEKSFPQFVWEYQCHMMLMNQLLSGDLAFYPNNITVSKRSAQGVSPGARLSYTGNGIYKQYTGPDHKSMFHDHYKHCIVLPDETRNALDKDIEFILNSSVAKFRKQVESVTDEKGEKRYSQEEADKIVNNYKKDLEKYKKSYMKYDSTDGQGLISLDYVGRFLKCLGRDTAYKRIYKKLCDVIDMYNPKLTGKEYEDNKALCLKKAKEALKDNDTIVETIKQFTFSQEMVETGEKNSQWLVPTQIKNAEYPLLDLVSLFSSKDETLLRLLKMMRDYGIDAIHFQSNVKVGGKTSVVPKQISEYASPADLIADIEKNISTKDGRERYVRKDPLYDVSLQQETPSHFEDYNIILGNQIMKLICNSVVDGKGYELVPERNGEKAVTTSDGKYGKLPPVQKIFFDALARKIVLNAQTNALGDIGFDISKSFDDNLKAKQKKNKDYTAEDLKLDIKYRISQFLRKEMNLSEKDEYDIANAIEFENGDFRLPTADPLIFERLSKMVVTTIKKTCQRLNVPGGQLVQVTDAVTIPNIVNEENEKKLVTDKNLKVVYKRDAKGNPVAIDHFEARMPVYDKRLYKYADEYGCFGEKEMKKIEKECPELLECIAYRIPTEGYCSMIPIKIVGFTNRITGGIIQLPPSVVALMGIDFDIDKLFVQTPDIKTVKVKNEATGEVTEKLTMPLPDIAEISESSEKETNNTILRCIRSILTHKDQLTDQTIPSNYNGLSAFSHIFANITHEAKESKGRVFVAEPLYDKFLKMDTETVKSMHETFISNDDICSIEAQMDIHNRNYSGKLAMSICASTSTVHSLARNWDLTVKNGIPFTLAGHYIGKNPEFDRKYCFDGYTTVHSLIKQFITASPDTAKDPVFNDLNITSKTVGITMTMLRLGFDLETTLLFMQQPAVKLYNEIAQYDTDINARKSMKTLKNYFSLLQNEINEGKDENDNDVFKFVFNAESDFTRESLIRYLGADMQTIANTLDPNILNDQYAILQILDTLLTISRETSIIRDVCNTNNQSSTQNANLYEMVAADQRIHKSLRVIKEGNGSVSKNLASVFEENSPYYNPFLATAYNMRHDMLEKYTDLLFPTFKYFMDNTHIKKSKNVRRLYQQWLTFLLFNANRIDENGNTVKGYLSRDPNLREYYKKYFPVNLAHKISGLTTDPNYSNNKFLNALKFTSYKTSPYIYIDSMDLPLDEVQAIKNDWELLLSGDDTVKEIAIEVFIYSLYKDGFIFKQKSIGRIVPTAVKLACPQYIEFLKNLDTMTGVELNELFTIFMSDKTSKSVGGQESFHDLYGNINAADKPKKNRKNQDEDADKMTIPTGIDTRVLNVDVDGFMLEEAEDIYSLLC